MDRKDAVIVIDRFSVEDSGEHSMSQSKSSQIRSAPGKSCRGLGTSDVTVLGRYDK